MLNSPLLLSLQGLKKLIMTRYFLQIRNIEFIKAKFIQIVSAPFQIYGKQLLHLVISEISHK